MKKKTSLLSIMSFSRKERRGIIILVLIIGLQFVYLIYSKKYSFIESPKVIYIALEPSEVNHSNEVKPYKTHKKNQKKRYKSYQKTTYSKNNTAPIIPEKFDPNQVNRSDLENWGLKKYVIDNWVKYIENGGRFKDPSDLGKVYGLDSVWFEKIKDSISIHQNKKLIPKEKPQTYSKPPTKRPRVSISINDTDTTELKKIRGIGSVLSKRIIKYKNKLGGFYNKDQLKEVWGLKDTTLNELLAQIYLDTSLITKVKINEISFDDLRKHPYLNYSQSNALIKYRKQHGHYKSHQDLSKVRLLNTETLQKLSPYIDYGLNPSQ